MGMLRLCCVVCLAVAVAGCGIGGKVAQKATEKAVEKAIESQASNDGKDVKAKIDLQSGSMKVVSNDGKEQMNISTQDGQTTMTSQEGGAKSVVGKGAKVPDTFPKDIPVYAGVEVTMASENAADKSFMVQAATKDAVDVVSAYYKKELAGKGWTESQTVNQAGPPPMQMLTYAKGDRELMVMIQAADKTTMLTLQTHGGN
ncbi:MAG: hypothetical protein NTU83_11240 [Candidatus Hydrogenedentes bacterium]|nr:hypothetical protein [Candidatus Hydrogenedentota bacterium]